MIRKIGAALKKNCFILFIILSLLLPDIVLRALCGAIFPISWTPTFFTLFWIALIVLAVTGFMSRVWGRGIWLGIAVLFFAFFVSSYVYYKIFGRFYWLDNAGMTGQALDYTGYVLQHVDWKLILLIAAEVALMVFTWRTWPREPYKISGLFLLVPLICLVTLHTSMMSGGQVQTGQESVQFYGNAQKEAYYAFTDTNRSMRVAGAYQYVFRNLCRIVFPEMEFDTGSVDVATQYFAENAVSENNDKTGLFAGKNVIMVMLESIDDWMIDETYTPTISYMQKNGINFENHFSCTYGTGYTFNTEFIANTGYHALTAGAPAASLSQNTYTYSLANLFREKGYSAKSFHFNKPEFYNRGEMHRAFGYEKYVSFSDYMPPASAQCDSVAIKSNAIYREMVGNGDQPFFDFVITYSAHLPYAYEDAKLQKIKEMYPRYINPYMDTEINNAKILAHDTDEFLRILLENLRRDGLAENTVIVAFSDHFAYGLSNWERMYKLSDASNADMLEETPFFIYCDGMTPEKVTKVTNSLDILPTLTNLFGLTKTPYVIGEDAFDAAYSGYVYFSNGSWYDGETYYVADENISNLGGALAVYIDEMNNRFYVREKVNEAVLRTDYFKKQKE